MYITQLLHRRAVENPNQPITIYLDRVRTASESIERVSKLAGALKTLGVAEGDRVGILSLNSDRFHEFLFAAPWAGAIVNPVNTRWSTAEIAYSLNDCDTRVLLVDSVFAAMLPKLRELVPNLSVVIHCGEEATPDGTYDYEQLIEKASPLEDVCRGGNELFGIFYTGGTTGNPKGVMLSHNSMILSALGSLATCDILSRNGSLLHVAPMFHLADIAAWVMGLIIGSENVFLSGFTPRAVADIVRTNQITDALLVPTMIQMLVDSTETSVEDFSSFRRILYGASPISPSVLQRAQEKMKNAQFTQAYGMTELAPIATLLTFEDHKDPTLTRSAGRGTAIVDIRIENPDGVVLGRDEVGEIVVRGDNAMQGYWNKPEETALALRDGWMHTGDAGYLDKRGYLFVVDRIKDMIITGGENVYSTEVENALTKHPSVATCAVIGLPDEIWGEKVHAVVVLRVGETVSEQELSEFCRDQIAGYKIPRSFAFVDSLPISGAGKILKRELRDQK